VPVPILADVVRSAFRARLVLAVVCLLLGGAEMANARYDTVATPPVYGVTVVDLSRVHAVLDSLRALPRRPWVRVVFNLDPSHPTDATPYVKKVGEVAAVGNVLGELVDSSDISRLTVNQTKGRAFGYVRALRSVVSAWEIGNEVNGNWTGPPALVARKVRVSYGVVRRFGGTAALTLYENAGCGDGPGELSPVAWSKRYLPAGLRDGLAYVLLSYYEKQCRGLRPSSAAWTRRFVALHRLFPNALLGFGEIGMPEPAIPSTRSAAASVISYYYGLRIPLRYYAGGGFYWYFAEDMVPWRQSPLWRVLAGAWSTTHAS
jgi:hypothetical protein